MVRLSVKMAKYMEMNVKTLMGRKVPIMGHFRECMFLLVALLSDR